MAAIEKRKGHGHPAGADHDPDADRSSRIQDRGFVVTEADHVRRLSDQRSAAEPRYGRNARDRFPSALRHDRRLSPLATHLPWDQHTGEAAKSKNRQRACGRAAIGTCEVRIVDAEHKPVASGVVGEVAVRGQNVMMKVIGNGRKRSARAVIDGWMQPPATAAIWTRTGYVYLVDRVKDMIISGGENVYSMEVENVIAQHPSVSQCAVIGIPSEQWGETVHAFVIPRDGAGVNAAEIIAFCKERIAHYKCPRSIDIRTEPFPLSGAGQGVGSANCAGCMPRTARRARRRRRADGG